MTEQIAGLLEPETSAAERAKFRSLNPDEVEQVAEKNSEIVEGLHEKSYWAGTLLTNGTASYGLAHLGTIQPSSTSLTAWLLPAAALTQASKHLEQRAENIEEDAITSIPFHSVDEFLPSDPHDAVGKLSTRREFSEPIGVTSYSDFEIDRSDVLEEFKPVEPNYRGTEYLGKVDSEGLKELLEEIDLETHRVRWKSFTPSSSYNFPDGIFYRGDEPVIGLRYDPDRLI